MRVWTVVNQKGGVGKTTTVMSLAGLLVQRGQRVLVIDTDPHGSLAHYLGVDPDKLTKSLFDLFHQHRVLTTELCQSAIIPTSFAKCHLLPASPALATLDRAIGNQPGMGFVLEKVVRALTGRYDVVLIDCSPVLGVLMVNALACCDHVVMPVQTEYLALKGLERMIQTIERMQHSGRPMPSYTIVPTMFDRSTKASLAALSNLARSYPNALWHSTIPADPCFPDASLAHIPPPQFQPDSAGVAAYSQLLDGLLEMGESHVENR